MSLRRSRNVAFMDPYRGDTGSATGIWYDQAGGVAHCLELPSVRFTEPPAVSIHRMEWGEVPEATVEQWVFAVSQRASVELPPDSFPPVAKRSCWECKKPVGRQHESLCCTECRRLVCVHCGACYSEHKSDRSNRQLEKEHRVEINERRFYVRAAARMIKVLKERGWAPPPSVVEFEWDW